MTDFWIFSSVKGHFRPTYIFNPTTPCFYGCTIQSNRNIIGVWLIILHIFPDEFSLSLQVIIIINWISLGVVACWSDKRSSSKMSPWKSWHGFSTIFRHFIHWRDNENNFVAALVWSWSLESSCGYLLWWISVFLDCTDPFLSLTQHFFSTTVCKQHPNSLNSPRTCWKEHELFPRCRAGKRVSLWADQCVWLHQQQTVLTMICLWKEQHRKERAGLQWESRKERADRTG